jgi:hypothetical protein
MSSYFTYEGNLRDRNKFTSTVNTSFGTKRYFSSLDTEVYFGSEQIDEMVAIDFTVSEPKLPIYGYNSFYANRMISGRRTIQGTFAINFTNHLYLYNVLSKIEDSVLKASYLPNGTEQSLDYESLLYRCEGDDSTGLGIGNNAVFSKIFDITLSYGHGKSDELRTYNGCYQTLVGVQIVEYRQALDTEGNPILDMYSFVAKDLMYATPGEGEEGEITAPSTPSAPDNEEVNVCPICEKNPCECIPEVAKANKHLEHEMKELTSKCQNSKTPGFIINPTFNYTPPGHYAASAYPYLRLGISSLNNNAEEYTGVSILIYDQLNGINTTLQLNNIKKDSSTIFEFKNSERDLGIDLRNFYTQNKEGYRARCIVEFYVMINGVDTKVSHTTTLFLGSTLD